MKTNEFKGLLELIKHLIPDQLQQADDAVTTARTSHAFVAAVEEDAPHQCPLCETHNVVRNGIRDGSPR